MKMITKEFGSFQSGTGTSGVLKFGPLAGIFVTVGTMMTSQTAVAHTDHELEIMNMNRAGFCGEFLV